MPLNSLVCWFCTSALGLILFPIVPIHSEVNMYISVFICWASFQIRGQYPDLNKYCFCLCVYVEIEGLWKSCICWDRRTMKVLHNNWFYLCVFILMLSQGRDQRSTCVLVCLYAEPVSRSEDYIRTWIKIASVFVCIYMLSRLRDRRTMKVLNNSWFCLCVFILMLSQGRDQRTMKNLNNKWFCLCVFIRTNVEPGSRSKDYESLE